MTMNCILTPTFIGHFQYLDNYLNSYDINVTDKDDCVIVFIVNKVEHGQLEDICKKYNNINYEILDFDEILERFGIDASPDELLLMYGKFSFQALKKFYGMLFLSDKYEKFLVLDTESIWLRKTSMKEMFENFFERDRFIVYSNTSKRISSSRSNLQASSNINFILHSNCDKWFVEQYVRFWDVNILRDIFDRYGTCIEIVKKIYEKERDEYPKIGLFESVLYDQFIYENNDKYQYRLVDLDEECESVVPGEIIKKYRFDMNRIWHGSCGLLESCSILLDKENYKYFAQVFKKNNLNIIRIETEPQNYKWQKRFLDIVQPNILTCSQENLFGVNYTMKTMYRVIRIKTPSLNFFITKFRQMLNSCAEVLILPWFLCKGVVEFVSGVVKIFVARRE